MGGRVARVVAQAKVNLFLRVLAREASGYHQLETLFCRLALGDEVVVRATTGPRSLDCSGDVLPPEGLGPVERNLAWRAALAFASATGWPAGFAIEIDKQIPVGGGLGGGSADAGAVLRALNALAPAALSPGDLLRLSAQLGADVPFLTQDHTPLALAWGRGERMVALPSLPERPCLLFACREGVVTADAYRWLTEAPAVALPPLAYSISDLGRWDSVELLAFNEFERVVLPRRPLIRGVVEGLRHPDVREVFPVALMSGSGATVFSLPAPPVPEKPDQSVHVLLGIETSGPEGEEVRVIESWTAAHVEPVRLGD